MSAIISECGLYRYELRRDRLCQVMVPGAVVWVMCNPSTADAQKDDPTIRKCKGFSRTWGYGRLLVVNVYALRSSDPMELLRHPRPMGDDNPVHLLRAFREAKDGILVFGWGDALPKPLRSDARDRLSSFAKNEGVTPMCLGRTKNGQPRHPLMLPYTCPLEPWLAA